MSIWESIMMYFRESWRAFFSVCCPDVEMQACIAIISILIVIVIIWFLAS